MLNEIVLDRGSHSFLTNIECYESGRFVTRVQADGLMLATPTGGCPAGEQLGSTRGWHEQRACVVLDMCLLAALQVTGALHCKTTTSNGRMH